MYINLFCTKCPLFTICVVSGEELQPYGARGSTSLPGAGVDPGGHGRVNVGHRSPSHDRQDVERRLSRGNNFNVLCTSGSGVSTKRSAVQIAPVHSAV